MFFSANFSPQDFQHLKILQLLVGWILATQVMYFFYEVSLRDFSTKRSTLSWFWDSGKRSWRKFFTFWIIIFSMIFLRETLTLSFFSRLQILHIKFSPYYTSKFSKGCWQKSAIEVFKEFKQILLPPTKGIPTLRIFSRMVQVHRI